MEPITIYAHGRRLRLIRKDERGRLVCVVVHDPHLHPNDYEGVIEVVEERFVSYVEGPGLFGAGNVARLYPRKD